MAGKRTMVRLELAYTAPFDFAALLGFLAERAVAGVEAVAGGRYRRVLDLPGGLSTLALGPAGGREQGVAVTCELGLADAADEPLATRLARRMLDLDAEPAAIAAALAGDPLLAPSLRMRPGLRVPGHVDGPELAVRAVLGQQVSVAAARTLAGRLAREHGAALEPADGALARAFPRPDALAARDPGTLPMPRARGRALVGLARALATGEVDLGPDADPATASRQLLALPGIGPWTVEYVRMRVFGDRDAFLASDLGVRRAFERAGLPGDPRSAAARAERWRPYRAYAQLHLWTGDAAPRADATASGGPGAHPRDRR